MSAITLGADVYSVVDELRRSRFDRPREALAVKYFGRQVIE